MDGSSLAPRPLADRAATPSGPSPQAVSGVAGIPGAAQARKAAAIRDVRDRFYAQWLRISADMSAEIARIEREYM